MHEGQHGFNAVTGAGHTPPGSRLLHWDGRIDNRRDLFLQLSDRTPRDASDGQLLLAAFDRWGIPGFGRVVGDWSAVVRDVADGRTVLASDYAGIRSLYYSVRSGVAHWSPRLDELVDALRVDTIDETYVAGFLVFGGCPTRTPYAGVYSVPPGHAVCVGPSGVTTRSFWSLPAGDVVQYRDERRYDEEFIALFREAVAVRLQTPAPVVAELSGGLDSSSVVCMANDLIRRGDVPAPSLTPVSYLHRGSLDERFIREVEQWCGLTGAHLSTHDLPLASEHDGWNPVPGNSSPIEQAASETARRIGARVFLTGQSGDLVTGNWFDDSLQVAGLLRRGRIADACADALAWSKVLRIPVLWILWRSARALAPFAGAHRLGPVEGMPVADGSSLERGLIERTGIARPHEMFSTAWLEAPPERRPHFFALTVLRELRTLQRLVSMDGLDYTHPFGHRPLVEFLMSVPPDVLCRPGEPRRLMRRALASLWPAGLRRRRSKSLLGAPQFEALKPLATRLLGDRQWMVVERGWVNREAFASRLEKLGHGIDCNVPQLRHIILLEFWLRRRQDGPMNAALKAG